MKNVIQSECQTTPQKGRLSDDITSDSLPSERQNIYFWTHYNSD